MCWKLAELKWRQELGLYESRWEMKSGTLPVERKKAIQAFERAQRQILMQPESPRRSPTQASGIREPSLGNHSVCRAEFPADGQHPLPAPPVPNGQLVSLSPVFSLFRSPSTASDSPSRARRARQACRDEERRGHCSAAQRQSLPALDSCKQLSLSAPGTSRRSSTHIEEAQVPLLQTSTLRANTPTLGDIDRFLINTESGFSSSEVTDRLILPTPSRLSSQNLFSDRLCNFLEYGGATFEILEADSEYFRQSLSTPPDSEETHWSNTESKHCSRSFLLDQTRRYNMPGGTSRPQNDDGREEERDRLRERPSSTQAAHEGPGSSRQGPSIIYQGSVPGSTPSTLSGILDHYAEGSARQSLASPLASHTVTGGTRNMASAERDQQQARAISQHVQRFIAQLRAAEDINVSDYMRVTPSSDTGDRSLLSQHYMSSLRDSIARERQSGDEQATDQTGDSNNSNVPAEVSAETEQAGRSDPEWQTTTGHNSNSDESTGLEIRRRD